MKVYVVDDELVFTNFLKRVFPSLLIERFADGYAFFSAMERERPERVIVDLSFDKLPRERLISRVASQEGLVIVKRLREAYPEIPVLLVSRFANAEIIRELRKLGVPFLDGFASEKVAEAKLRQFFGMEDERARKDRLKEIKELFARKGFITETPYIIEQLAGLDLSLSNKQSLLIVGETGTGKTFLAKVLHRIIFGSKGPFQEFNLTRVPEHLIESELFGYDKGAFTGAYISKAGYLEKASGGTLLIDEIGYLNYQQQGKLLKAIEDGFFTRVGSTVPIKSGAKIIGATSADPARQLREDLLYRFSSLIYLPPLNERREDIARFIQLYKAKGLRLTRSAERFLQQADYPGNVRMLLNMLDFMVKAPSEITIDEAIKIYERWKPEWKRGRRITAIEQESDFEEEKQKVLEQIMSFVEKYNLNLKSIEKYFLAYLFSKGLKVERIATLMGISRATVFRLKEKLQRGEN